MAFNFFPAKEFGKKARCVLSVQIGEYYLAVVYAVSYCPLGYWLLHYCFEVPWSIPPSGVARESSLVSFW